MAERKTKVPFVSCIKVKGIHLLPPVITQKRRAELQGYKQQAIKLERRLKNCKDLKKNLEDLLNMQPLTDRSHSEISFRDNNHVEALGLTDKTGNTDYPSKTKELRKIKLSQDIIDVTQYNNDGIKIICNDDNCITLNQGHYVNLNKNNTNTLQQIELSSPLRNNQDINSEHSDLNSVKLNKNNRHDKKSRNKNLSEIASLQNISSSLEKSPRPRLIRSNSYTLETPSPILLAHLEKTEKSNKNAELKSLEDVKNLSISRNWSSLENNYIPFENSEFSSINTVYNTSFNDSEKINMSPDMFIEKKEQQNSESNSPAINVIQTDISVQKITVNTSNEVVHDALNDNSETSDSQLLQVLKTLPDEYAKQIIEIIESQKLEKHKLIDYKEEPQKNVKKSDVQVSEKYDSVGTANNRNEDLRNPILNTNVRNDCRTSQTQNVSFSGSEKLQGSTTSISPSQSIYYSLTSSDTLRPLSNSSVRLIDFECDDTITSDDISDSPKKTDITEYYVHEEIRKGMNVSRELFPQMEKYTIHNNKKEWAASIIGAHVKGYLTRRLLKTERVQSLIDTIKDALMCALQLHNAENIDESDVELHRRLINQVSAACYTFHDIFFALTVQEQMLIIATDRQRKLEKAKRPASAPPASRSKTSSTRSTPRQRVSSHSRSLTKV